MITNTSKTYLKYAATEQGTFADLCPITNYPDIFTPPERLDTTTLSNEQRTYIPGIKDVPEMTFGAWYEKTQYETIKGLVGKTSYFQLHFGENGEHGKFSWAGDLFVTPTGGEVGGVRGMQITCYPSTEIKES